MDLSGLTTRDIIGMFYARIDVDLLQTWMGKIGIKFTSDQEQEVYKWLGQSPQMREWIGGRNPRGLRDNGITIINKKYESTLEIEANDFRRDKTGQIMVRFNDQVDRTITHWGKLLTALIVAGEVTVCYDGQNFFDTDHEEGDSGAQKNLLTSTEVSALNVTTPAAPTASEMADAIMGIIGYMYKYVDNENEPMNETAKKFMVMGPVSMWPAIQTAISEKKLDTGSGSRDNPLISEAFSVESAVNPRLDIAGWTTNITVYRTDSTAAPFILQEEEEPEIQMLGEGSEHTFWNDVVVYGIKALRNVGFGYWQYATKSTFS